MEKRTLLAFVLITVVWIVWFALFKPAPKNEPGKIPDTRVSEQDKKKPPATETKTVKKSKIEVNLKNTSSPQKVSTFDYETGKYKITFTNRGATIKSFYDTERKLEITVPHSKFKARGLIDFPIHFNSEEFQNGNPLEKALWNHSVEKENIVSFSTNITLEKSKLRIDKIFQFNGKQNSFRISYRITNKSRKSFVFPDNSIIISPADILGPRLDYENTYNTLSGIYSENGEYEQVHKGGGFFSEGSSLTDKKGTIDYVGIMSRYLLLIMMPEDFKGTGVLSDGRKETGFRTGIVCKVDPINPGDTVTKNFTVYLGEKDKDKLNALNPVLKDAADISKWIEPIRYFVMWCLLNLNDLIGNMGWSLVIFSILSKIVFMPLTLKSNESMKKMNALAPKIKELKAKYKDKPEVIQKETMKLYKEHKVNPMGGCFPLLLQMPFFFALYSALINSIDLWQAPFILWMNDLSMPDTIMTISGFNINVLPILMTGSTILQQKLTTIDTGQQQKMMMYMMPLVFVFIFWTMPSGLVLYWTLQNMFQVLHQIYVNKRDKDSDK